MNFELKKIKLDLKVNWKLSRNETLFKENFIFKIVVGEKEFLGEVAPNIRYQETPEKIQADFDQFQKDFIEEADISSFLYSKNYSHSFQFAVESAFVHMQAADANVSVSDCLGLERPISVDTSYSVPIMDENLLADYLKDLNRFKYIKIKVNADNATEFVKEISKHTQAKLRVDGNEAWSDYDRYKKFEESIKDCNIQFIEQPFKSTMVDEYIRLKPDSLFEIMADESIEQTVDFDSLQKQFHSINVKLMKAGGYYKAIVLLTEARSRGLKTMLGCMIETSLGISCALHLSSLGNYFDLDGSMLIKKDPFNFIKESNGTLSLN